MKTAVVCLAVTVLLQLLVGECGVPKEQHSSHTNNWAVLVRCCTSYSTVVTVYDTGIGVFLKILVQLQTCGQYSLHISQCEEAGYP